MELKHTFDVEMGYDPNHGHNPLSHTLESPGNFGVINGEAVFLDAGSVGVREALSTQPEGISRALGRLAKAA